MAGSACQRGAVPGSLAPPPAARRILEARLRLRGLSRRALPGLRDRRLGRWVLQCDRAPARRSKRAPQGLDRSLVARLSTQRLAWPRDRLPSGGAALVVSLAERGRYGDHGLAHV